MVTVQHHNCYLQVPTGLKIYSGLFLMISLKCLWKWCEFTFHNLNPFTCMQAGSSQSSLLTRVLSLYYLLQCSYCVCWRCDEILLLNLLFH